MARGYMISEGWIYNNELKQYLDPKTYITGETVDIKNYKAMLLSFMQYKVDNGLADDAKEVVGYADKVRKYTEKIIGKMDENAKKNIRKDLDRFRIESYKMTREEVREGMQKIWNKYKLTDTIENDKRVYHIEGFEELSKALKISGKIFKVFSTTLSDLLDIINVETKLETIEQYRKFLEIVADGKDYLPGDLVIAANQLLKETIEPYQRQIVNYIYDTAVSVDGTFDITKTLKNNITESIKTKYPDLFKTDAAKFAATFGEAIAVIETSAVVVDALTKVGTVIKDASYVEAYAYLGQYFTILLRDKRDQFRANETIENAWEFYDMYHLLFRVRTCGENAYLKMCKESAITKILAWAGFKWFDITDREQFVKDTFKYMNDNCFFGLDNADEIPEAHRFAQKAVIKCPVDVEVYDNSGILVYTVQDGSEQDVTNELGRFVCKYDPKLGEYIKIICLNDRDNYHLKTVGRDAGNVSIESAKAVSETEVETAKITGLPIEKNGVINVDLNTHEYEDDIYGNSSNTMTGKLQITDQDVIVPVESLSLSEETVIVKKFSKKALGVTIQPLNATYSNVTWESSDDNIVSVSGGAILAKSPGTAIITAKTSNGKTSSCTVNVFANTSSLSSKAILKGDSITVNASAEGGLGNYEYAVYYKPKTQTRWMCAQNYSRNSTVTITPKYAKNYTIRIKAKDSSEIVANRDYSVTVKPVLQNTSKISSANIQKGESVTVTANATGGFGKYQYAVFYKQKAQTKWACAQKYDTNNTISITPKSVTNYTIRVKVKDANGNIKNKDFAVKVTKPLTNKHCLPARS